MVNQSALILSYRETDAARRANLEAVLTWLAQEAPQLPVWVLEQDTYPRLQSALPHPRCQVVFAYNLHPFNKAWGFNVAMRAARASVLVFSDADLIVAGQVQPMLDACARHPAAKPYRRLFDLSEAESAKVRAGQFATVPAPSPGQASGRAHVGEHLVPCGGMFAIRTDALLHLGGWDERFVGWGGEDDAMSVKLQRARIAMAQLDGTALHLAHPRAVTALDPGHYAQNQRLLAQTHVQRRAIETDG